MADLESINYLFTVESLYIHVTSGDVGSGVADRDPHNIWNPQKKMRIFRRRYVVGTGLRPTLVFSITYSFIAFPLTPKHVTLNDLEWPFCVKFCFAPVCLEL